MSRKILVFFFKLKTAVKYRKSSTIQHLVICNKKARAISIWKMFTFTSVCLFEKVVGQSKEVLTRINPMGLTIYSLILWHLCASDCGTSIIQVSRGWIPAWAGAIVTLGFRHNYMAYKAILLGLQCRRDWGVCCKELILTEDKVE